MLQSVLAIVVLTSLQTLGFAHGTANHVDINPADMYVRSLDESQNVELRERQKRQSGTPETRELFVTQCGYYNTEPEGEPSINVKGIDLSNWAAVEKTAELVYLMVRFMPRPIFVQLASSSSVGLFSVISLPTLVFDEFADIGGCLASCSDDCRQWCTPPEYSYYPSYPISYLWAYGNMSRTFVVETNMLCEGYNPSNGNENLLVREYGLTVMTRGVSNETRDEIRQAFYQAQLNGKWPQIQNEYEYFMKATLIWFDASKQQLQGGMSCKAQFNCGTTNPEHRLYLKQEDPELYRLLNHIYNNNREYLNSETSTCNW